MKKFKTGEDVMLPNQTLRGVVIINDNSGELPSVTVRFHDLTLTGSAIDDLISLNQKTTEIKREFKVGDKVKIKYFAGMIDVQEGDIGEISQLTDTFALVGLERGGNASIRISNLELVQWARSKSPLS